MNRSKLLLCILLLCFAASLVYAVLRTPRQRTVERLTYPPRQTPTVHPFAATSSSHPLHQTTHRAPEYTLSVKRNLFAPFYPKAVPSAATKRTPTLPVVAPPLPPPLPPTAQEIARQKLTDYRFVGTLTRQNLQVAFLMRGSEVQLVRVGDIPYPGFRVSAITADSLTLQSAEGTDSIILHLK